MVEIQSIPRPLQNWNVLMNSIKTNCYILTRITFWWHLNLICKINHQLNFKSIYEWNGLLGIDITVVPFYTNGLTEFTFPTILHSFIRTYVNQLQFVKKIVSYQFRTISQKHRSFNKKFCMDSIFKFPFNSNKKS